MPEQPGGMRWACAVCGVGLFTSWDEDTNALTDYWHAIPTDHDPVLTEVPEADLVTRCDFCSNPGPRWEFRVEPFVIHNLRAPDYHDDGRWACCAICRVMVERGWWKELFLRFVNKAMDQHPNALLTIDVEQIHRIYDELELRAPAGEIFKV
jgi:hypothetical protein